jgi:hypothetical protein
MLERVAEFQMLFKMKFFKGEVKAPRIFSDTQGVRVLIKESENGCRVFI